jgi:hypothetical protein
VARYTANALEQAPAGGGGGSDWTAGEKEQIRDALGIDGTKTAATGGQLQAVLDDTGTAGVVVAAASKSGYSLSAAGIQAIWDALTSALTTASSIGKLLVDNINATISSRATQTSVDTVDTVVDAIKAKTDNLPSDPADESSIQGTLATIAGYIDTEMAAVKTVTDKLDDTLEDDGGTYRFTTNALEQAPAGGGGLTQQDVRDAMKLAPTAGSPAAGSVDAHLDNIEADTGTDGVVVATGSKTGYALSTAGNQAVADEALDRSNAIETGLTLRGALRLIAAACAGKASGLATTTAVYRNAVADSKARLTATVDADGNRTAVSADTT